VTGWTTPEMLRERLAKRWYRGIYLAALAACEEFEPIDLKITGPKTSELNSRREEVQAWAGRWHQQAQRRETAVSYRATGGRGLVGQNQLPDRTRIESLADLECFLGTTDQTRRYRELLTQTSDRPALAEWVTRRPMRALEHHEHFAPLMAALDWIEANAGTGRRLREIDAAGVDTKFVERHQRILLELGRLVVADDLIKPGGKSIAGRFGFAVPDRRVRFRRLDDALDWPLPGFDDVEVRAEDLAATALDVEQVYIIENLATYLSFPQSPRAVAIFGGGYAATVAGAVDWLRDVDVHYWGDLDTHGLTILDRLRVCLPRVQSMLMDRETLLAHRPLWGSEPSQVTRDLPNLTPEESQCYHELIDGTHGRAIRLEQERVPLPVVERHLEG